MQRVTISMSNEFAAALDAFMTENGYENRSEAVRDLARLGLDSTISKAGPSSASLATLTYVYDHGMRELPKRLTAAYHDHHDLSVAMLHIHLDHENCLEVSVLRGDNGAITSFAQKVISERGVRHGRVHFIPVQVEEEVHRHGAAPHHHVHIHPKS
jgi:CopG family nickel-responsive transcriptional regulator